MGTKEGLEALVKDYETLHKYGEKSTEELIALFDNEESLDEERDWAVHALVDVKKDPCLPDFFLEKIKFHKDSWRFFLIEESYRVKFGDWSAGEYKGGEKCDQYAELLLEILEEIDDSDDDWGKCSCLMRYVFLTDKEDGESINKIYPYFKKGSVNQRWHVYRGLKFYLFDEINDEFKESIRQDCRQFLDRIEDILERYDKKEEAAKDENICFISAMRVLAIFDREEFDRICQSLRDKDKKWLAEYIEDDLEEDREQQKLAQKQKETTGDGSDTPI